MKSWMLNRKSLLSLLPVLLGITHFGCGSGPKANISVAVTNLSSISDGGTVQVGATAQYTVLVQGDPRNAGVNWSVTCPVGSCGRVAPSSTANQGLVTYIPPATLPSRNLKVTLVAASITEPSVQGSLTILVPSVSVTVTPQSTTVPFGGTGQFTATIAGDSSNAGVTWILHTCHSVGFDRNVCVNPPSCNCGMISSNSSASGVAITYTAPASTPVGGTLTLTATSVANGDASFVVPIMVSASSASAPINPAAPESDAGEALETREADRPVQYRLINLGTLGGSASNGFGGPNNRGWVTGDANLAGDQTEHGFLWHHGVMTDLGTLGGLNSSVPTPVKNDRGLITGVAQTSVVDPLGEFWGSTFFCGINPCDGFQNLEVGFIWHDGVMTQLPTLGGNNGAALGANNKGEAVGVAETAIRDPNCTPNQFGNQVLDFRAVIWGPKSDEIRSLPPFPGDSVSAAFAINDEGQVVGTSGVCQVPGFFAFAVHPVLWENGTVTDLGGFGGTMFNVANAINNRGQVVGQSDLPGDTFTHAFFWENGVITDLGTLPGDSSSIATDINERGQVVGVSCDATGSFCRAFLWEEGVMTDLNTLIPTDSPLFLTFGGGINDRGEIAGTACVVSNGACTSEAPAFLAIPCGLGDKNNEECRDAVERSSSASVRPAAVPPNDMREHLGLHRGFGRFGNGPSRQ